MLHKNPKLIIVLLLMAAMFLPGCSMAGNGKSAAAGKDAAPNGVDGSQKGGAQLLAEPVLPRPLERFDWEAKDKLREDNALDADFVTGLNTFAMRTGSAVLQGQDVNRNFSPVSLYYALALAAAGAEGQTQKELLDLLGVDDMADLSRQSGNMFRLLFVDNEVTKLHLANSLWIDHKLKVTDAYIKNALANYYAWIFAADFADKSTNAAVARWVSDNTNGKIEPPISLDDNTVMLILNTVYFYDEWRKTFAEALTVPNKFILADGKSIECDFMHAEFSTQTYYKGEGFMRTDLDLQGGGVMTLILPDEGVAADSLLASPDKLQAALTGGTEDVAKMLFKMPKFKYGSQTQLVEMLQTLGVREAFTGKADFSGINGTGGLYVSDIMQQTHIGVDEKGVEAAAVTMVMVGTTSMPIGVAKTVEFYLERPFIYVISSPEGIALFIGVCDNPLQN